VRTVFHSVAADEAAAGLPTGRAGRLRPWVHDGRLPTRDRWSAKPGAATPGTAQDRRGAGALAPGRRVPARPVGGSLQPFGESPSWSGAAAPADLASV